MNKDQSTLFSGTPDKEIAYLKESISLLNKQQALLSIQYYQLINFTNTAFLILDNNGKVIDCNAFAATLLAKDKHILINNFLTSLINKTDIPPFNAWFNLVWESKKQSSLSIIIGDEIGKHSTLILQSVDFESESFVTLYLNLKSEAQQSTFSIKEKNYETLIENAYDGVMIYNLSGDILDFNDKAHTYLGYSKQEFQQMKLLDLFFAVELIKNPISFKKIISGDAIVDNRTLKRKDGSGIEMELNSKMMPDGTILVFGRDITERIKNENEKQYLSNIVKSNTDQIFIVNLHSIKFEYANNAALEMLGYTDLELYKLSPLDITPGLSADDLKKLLAPLISREKNKVIFETFQKRKDNSVYPVEVFFQLTNLGEREVFLNVTRDITERRYAAMVLANKEKYFRTLIEYNSSAIVLFDEVGNFIYQSPVVEKILGYQLEEGVQSNFLSFIHPDDKEEVNLKFKELLKQPKNVFKGCYRFLHSKGHYIWLEGNVVNYLDLEPINALIANYSDVTDKVLAEESLKAERSLLRTLIDNLPDPIYVKDIEGKKIIANKADQFYMALSTEEDAVGKTDIELYPGSVGIIGHEYDQHVINEGKSIYNLEDEFVDRNDLQHWLLNSRIILKGSNNNIIGLLGINRNITERKMIEMELLKSNERYEYMLKATFDVIWDWDITAKELAFGDNYEKYFGYKLNSNSINLLNWSKYIHPDDFDLVQNSLYEVINGTNNIWSAHYRFKKKNGEYAYLYDKGIVIRNEKGKAIRMIGAMHDITLQKYDEENVKKLNKELANKAIALVNSNNELEKFGYVVSHDLQEPLRMVTSFLNLLQKQYEQVLDDSANKYINYAVDGANRMKNLIRDLLEYSRVSTSKTETGDTDMNKVMAEILETFMIRVQETNALIEYEPLPVLPNTRKSLMLQLMQNLIGNALKYQGKNRPHIKVYVLEQQDDWLFSVADNGIGIDIAFMEKIFVIFQRLHNKDQFSGTGIGLSICKKIVEIHGGKIWFIPNENGGSIFQFTISKN